MIACAIGKQFLICIVTECHKSKHLNICLNSIIMRLEKNNPQYLSIDNIRSDPVLVWSSHLRSYKVTALSHLCILPNDILMGWLQPQNLTFTSANLSWSVTERCTSICPAFPNDQSSGQIFTLILLSNHGLFCKQYWTLAESGSFLC